VSVALVTGATGFVGGHVAADLLENGWTVRALVRPESMGSDRMPGGCAPVAGDLLVAPADMAAARGVDAVFHVAARYSLARSRAGEVYRTNTEGTANVLRAAADAGAPVVHCSSVATIGLPADGAPGTEDTPLPPSQVIGAYKRSKVASERMALDAAARGPHDVVLNPTAPDGPGDLVPTPTGRIMTDFLAGRMPAYVDTGLNLVDVRDVAAGHRLALERGTSGRRYILGHQNMTLRQILHTLAALSGRRAPRVRIPHALAIAAAAVDEAVEGRLLGREPLAPLDGALMARKRMWVDGSRAVRELGLPQSPVRDALADAIAWARGRAAA
jgi:dihydroflavonol-4-reductase